MTAADKPAVLSFARALPPRDLLFLRRDITSEYEVDGWIGEIEQGRVTTILASAEDTVVGYVTLDRGTLRWTWHVAEIRVLVAEAARGHGLGHILLQIGFDKALAAGVTKIAARMTVDQPAARALFESLGFEFEAVLRNHVIDASGRKHDLIVLSFDTERHQLLPCDSCGRRVVGRLSLEGAQLCWPCYDLRYADLGIGD